MVATVMTVRGPVPASSIKSGGILIHQRVLEKEGSIHEADIPLEDLIYIRENPKERGNFILSHEHRAFRELERLVSANVNCVVDIHSRTCRDITRLYRLADQLDLHVIASTSLDLSNGITTMNEMKNQLVMDLQYGIDGSSIQAGVIYQTIDLGFVHESYLEAIGQAQRTTNAPVYFSFESSPSLEQVVAFLNQYGAYGTLERVVLCHCDVWIQELSLLENLIASTSVHLCFDLLGLYAVSDWIPFDLSIQAPNDAAIATCVARLIGIDSKRILLSSTVTQRIQYSSYGGGGMLHHSTSFRKRLTNVTSETWHEINYKTPLALVSGYVPPPQAAIPKDYLVCSICHKSFEPIVGEYFTKFEYFYCTPKCLRKHRIAGFAPVDQS